MKPEPKHMHTAWLCWLIAAAIFVTFLSGCERVKEYRCTAEQIQAVEPELDMCDRIADGNMLKRRTCYEAAQAAHCELIADFHRTEIVRREN